VHFLTTLRCRPSRVLTARPGQVTQSQGLIFSTTMSKALANRSHRGSTSKVSLRSVRCYTVFNKFSVSTPVSTAVSSSTGNQQHIQRSPYEIKLSIQAHSLTEMHQRSTPPNGHLYGAVIWSVSWLRSARGMACSAGKCTPSCSSHPVIMPSLTRKCVIGVGSSSWAGGMSKAKEGPADLRFQGSASNSECTQGDATCFSSMHS
jgi:hypothetical protein